jgi:hypothetical protein
VVVDVWNVKSQYSFDLVDCWDGEEEPIIYHGHTLTSRITFRSVIETVKTYAFFNNSFPVVLSIENHCSHDQQVMMANIMKEVLGRKNTI